MDKELHDNTPKDQRRWFEKVYETHFTRLYQFAFTITKERQAAEDVVSEVFLNLLNSGKDASEIRELDNYLFVSVKNRAVRAVTHDPYRFESLDFRRTMSRVDKLTPEHLMVGKELYSEIENTISALPDQCKLVYELVKIQRKKHAEVAEELGISESTVKNQITKALARIREAVEKHLKD